MADPSEAQIVALQRDLAALEKAWGEWRAGHTREHTIRDEQVREVRGELAVKIAQMNRIREDFFSRPEHESFRGEIESKLAIYKEAVDKQLHDLGDAAAEARGKASQSSVNAAFVLALFGLLIALGTLITTVIRSAK